MQTKIIAEIGINHNGSLENAKALALMARDCGCDFVKIQKREIDWCYSKDELEKPCESPWGSTLLHKLRGRELNWSEVGEFGKYCREIRIEWFCSCFDLFSLRTLHDVHSDRLLNKVPSAMAMKDEFLHEIAAQRILTLISTGLLTTEQIDHAISIFEGWKCEYIINHCIALYPCPQERLNLLVIPVLQDRYETFEHCRGIGYSGHETGVLPSIIAANLGAKYIERHITLDRTMYGADQAASLEKNGLQRLVRDIKSLPIICGNGDRTLHGDEKNPITFFRNDK